MERAILQSSKLYCLTTASDIVRGVPADDDNEVDEDEIMSVADDDNEVDEDEIILNTHRIYADLSERLEYNLYNSDNSTIK
ncbi:predicted protein [Histoplasma mississippiense (nom. inval.)]|uniref:predicted protein n=1 Tax=Ajellomyces capsulatus (strain NAm1 / WU24) TaxID=2059318 RepID=UPI000157BB40|nr:predicted protein [Histoplasma mississippiense (nom. inval.)]EDN04182.1 predicted protein [Histoplasma mississippiense (nom. inval.)]